MSQSTAPIVALAITFALLAVATIGSAAPSPPLTMQIKPTLMISSLDPANQNVTASTDSNTQVTYNAKVTVSKPPGLSVTVTLSASCSVGFPITVTPNSITFTQPGTVPITIMVVVPVKARMVAAAQVQVNALGTFIGGSMAASASGILSVKQYYDLSATIKVIKGSGNPQKFEIIVQNKGNGNDTISLEIVDKSALEKDGFRFEFSKTRLTDVAPDMNVSVSLEISYGVATPSGRKEIKIKATSLNSTDGGGNPKLVEASTTVDVGALGGGGSQTYMIIGLIVLMVFVISLLFVMYKKNKLGKVFKGRTIKIPQIKKDTAKVSLSKEKSSEPSNKDEEE